LHLGKIVPDWEKVQLAPGEKSHLGGKYFRGKPWWAVGIGRCMVGYRRGRPCTAWIDNIKSWTGLSVEESIRMTEERDKWRKYVHGVANPRIEEG